MVTKKGKVKGMMPKGRFVDPKDRKAAPKAKEEAAEVKVEEPEVAIPSTPKQPEASPTEHPAFRIARVVNASASMAEAAKALDIPPAKLRNMVRTLRQAGIHIKAFRAQKMSLKGLDITSLNAALESAEVPE